MGKSRRRKTYFLNKVDEADLAALVEQGEPAACSCTDKCHAGEVNTSCPLCAVNMSECVGKEPEPDMPEEPAEADPAPEPEKTGGASGMLAVVLAVALAGGGAAYFLKFKKKKPDIRGSADLEDYDYGDEDEGEYEDAGDGADGEGGRMRYFTSNPLERLMMQPPPPRQEQRAKPAPAQGPPLPRAVNAVERTAYCPATGAWRSFLPSRPRTVLGPDK